MEGSERKQKKQRKHDEDTPMKRKKLTMEHESSLEEQDTSMKKTKTKKKLTEESSTPIAESSAKRKSKKHEESTPGKGKKLTKELQASQEEEVPQYKKKKKQKLMKEFIEESSAPIEEISANKKREKQRPRNEKSSETELAMKKQKQKEKQKKRKKRLKEKLDSTANGKIRRPEEDPQSDVSAREKRGDSAMNVFFRLLVPSKELGKVIGEHGSRVQQLREQIGARIKIGDAIMNLDERVIWISSKEDSLESQSAAERALLRVATLLVEPENEDQEIAKIRLLIAGSQAGSLVGKDGVAIDKLKKNTGAVVQVLTKERFPLLAFASETDRLVQLEGKVSQVLMALELIAVKLRKSPPRKRDVKGHKGSMKGGAFKSSVQIRIPNDLIGKVIGKDGATIWQIRQQCGVSIEVDEFKDGEKDRAVHIKGALSQVTMAQTLLQVFLASKKRTE